MCVHLCVCVCGCAVCGFQGAVIKKVAISFHWLRSNRCIEQHYAINWPDTLSLCQQIPAPRLLLQLKLF